MKKIVFLIIIIILIISAILFSKNVFKKSQNGNNMSSQEIVDKLLNTNSYVSEIEVQVKSNKNENKYIIKQEYNTENGCIQEILEPKNLAGIKTTQKDNKLIIENTELGLRKIFENYGEIENNDLDLSTFIEELNNNESEIKEKEGKIIIKITPNTDTSKILYINKEKMTPEKLLIRENNKKTETVIKYNNIELY